MPSIRSSIRSLAGLSTSGGSFVQRESNFNHHGFRSARDDASRPYPSAESVYIRSNQSHPNDDEFADLGLNDFFVVHRRVARRKLERLHLDPFQAGLFSRGVQPQFDHREPSSDILEAAIGYA